MRNPLSVIPRFAQRRQRQIVGIVNSALGFRTAHQRDLGKYWEYFTTNEVVHAAIMESVRGSSGIPQLVERYEDGFWKVEDETNNIPRRLDWPNPYTDSQEFRTNCDLQEYVSGNAIVAEVPQRESNRVLGPLHLLPTAHVFDERDGHGRITSYWYDPKKRVTRGPGIRTLNRPSKEAREYDARYVLHRKYVPDPEDPQWGLSPLSACVDSVEADYSISSYITNFFDAGAVPPYMFVSKVTLSDEQKVQISDELQKFAGGGVNNAWRWGIIDGTEGDVKRLGLAAGSREIGLHDLRKSVEARILSVLNVPPIVVGSIVGLENATYSNYEQARMAMHEENTDPFVRKRDSAFTGYLRRRFPDQMLRVRGNTENVLAVQLRDDQRSLRVAREVQWSILSRGEGRARLGYPQDALSDILLVPLNMVPTPIVEGAFDVQVTAEDVSALAGSLGDNEATNRTLQEYATRVARSMNGDVVYTSENAFLELPGRQSKESKRDYARRLLVHVDASTRQAVNTARNGSNGSESEVKHGIN